MSTRLIHQRLQVLRSLTFFALMNQLGQFFQLGIAGEFGLRVTQQSGGMGVVMGLDLAIDLLGPAHFGFVAHLLTAAFGEPFDLEFQARILAVNGAQDFPLPERLAELCLLFQTPRLGDDGVDQVGVRFSRVSRRERSKYCSSGNCSAAARRMSTRLSRSGSAATLRSTSAM